MNETNKLVASLKDAGQDHEFYPTTNEIIQRMVRDIKHGENEDYRRFGRIDSFLDIGAGNGKVLRALKEALESHADLYAIEKSLILCKELAQFSFVVGTDFLCQSLLAKQIDITFCNPPYSAYEAWATKIIMESASKVVYLVVPVRWQDSSKILDALKYREAEYKILGEYSFEDAEDRAAQAIVNLIRVELPNEKDDAFDRFFDTQFAGLKAKFDDGKKDNQAEPDEKQDPRFNALVESEDYPGALVALYNSDIALVQRNYELVGQLDVCLLKEFGVTPDRILGCLKAKLAELRNTYWQELFAHMKPVTNRLCAKKRNELLSTLNSNGHVDFTADNIYAVVIWILENANRYIDEQLVETFEMMVSKANVKNYKSNQRVFTFDRWRYNEEKPTHIALEYRLVLDRCGGISRSSWEKGLARSATEFLGDLLTVAYNLGFNCDTTDSKLWRDYGWAAGQANEFRFVENGKEQTLFEVRAFLNGNLHIRLNQKFALALNVEHGRLKGWIKSPAEAVDELGDLQAANLFGSHFRLGASSVPQLMAPRERAG